jgi:hypothetical protein
MKMTCLAGFDVLTAASMKMAVFWVVALCSLVEIYRRFGGTCCLHHQIALMMEAASTYETSVNSSLHDLSSGMLHRVVG